ncbi:MAG TPA: hypothetical protein EYQ06_05000 [Flavobacteriales bacterium]|nr:hypothetical protein [Flavobacteriales bacterium]
MGKLKLILTADYEVFGNGSGCVKKCMVEPTIRMLDICDKYGAKLTLFIDVCEYWAFKKIAESGLLSKADLPHVMIENQLKDVIKRGHDVQLHFHPQWLDAKYEGGEWILDNNYWRLPLVESHPDWDLIKLFKEGKDTLESIIKPIKPDYSCNIFRAGAWCIQDEEKVLNAMRENNFIIDSTVAPNMCFDDGLTFYDFNNTPDKPSWIIQKKVIEEREGGSITEIFIYIVLVPWYCILYFKILKVLKNIPFKPYKCMNNSGSNSRKISFKGLFKSQYRMFNFCDATTFQELKYFTKQAEKKYPNYNNVPIVMIGHPKTFGNEKEFERFLSWASKKETYSFLGYY